MPTPIRRVHYSCARARAGVWPNCQTRFSYSNLSGAGVISDNTLNDQAVPLPNSNTRGYAVTPTPWPPLLFLLLLLLLLDLGGLQLADEPDDEDEEDDRHAEEYAQVQPGGLRAQSENRRRK